MEKEDIIKCCKYYKGESRDEANRTMDQKGGNAYCFWMRESEYCRTSDDNKAIYRREASRQLPDTSSPEEVEQRAIYLFVYDRVAKWMPDSDKVMGSY